MKNRHDPPAPAPAPAPALSPAPGGGLRRLDSAVTLQPRADERVAASSGSEAEAAELRVDLHRVKTWMAGPCKEYVSILVTLSTA